MMWTYYEQLLTLVKPLISPILIPEQCFTTLFVSLQIFDILCLKMLISKLAGYGIVVLSSIVKLPMILNIIKAKSAVGLSESSVYIEGSMQVSMVIYNTFIQTPFSTYGENYIMFAQNVLLSLLVWHYNSIPVWRRILIVVAFSGITWVMLLTPKEYWPMLVVYASLCACASRVPQIWVNFVNGHTGILSLVTTGMTVAGAAVRLFTLLQEVNDVFAIAGTVLPLLLNTVVLIQIIATQKKTQAHFAKKKAD